VNVLVLDEGLPHPPDSGKRIRTWELLRRLAGEFRVAFLYAREGDASPADEEAVRAAGIEPIAVPVPRLVKRGPRFAATLLVGVPRRDPYMVRAHRPRALREAAAAEIERRRPDLIHVEWTPLLSLVPEGCRVPVCVSAHNVESDVFARYVERAGFGPKRAFLALERGKVERFERAALSRADAVLAVSEGDAARIRGFGARRVVVVENAVDAERFAPDPAAAVDPDEVLFTGSLDWRPNQDAVEWLLADVLPRLRARRPSVKATVVGRSPPADLARRWGAVPGVRVHGSVPDVRPFVARAAVSVVPLRIGGGSRLKIPEALAMGRPVVSTTIGAEGLDVGDGVVLADGADAFAEATAAALEDPATALARAARGRARVLLRHEWGAVAPKMAAAWREAAGASPAAAGAAPRRAGA
jgi:glycosyltransferase involved in cell wall biosynthesis